MVAHDFNLAYLQPDHLAEFQRQFPKHQLPGMLMNFSLPKRLSEHMNPLAHSRSAVEERLEMVQWLLQREMLALLQTYVFLQVGKEQGQRAEMLKLDSVEGIASPQRASDDDFVSSMPPSPQLAGTSPARVRRERYASTTSTTSDVISEVVGEVGGGVELNSIVTLPKSSEESEDRGNTVGNGVAEEAAEDDDDDDDDSDFDHLVARHGKLQDEIAAKFPTMVVSRSPKPPVVLLPTTVPVAPPLLPVQPPPSLPLHSSPHLSTQGCDAWSSIGSNGSGSPAAVTAAPSSTSANRPLSGGSSRPRAPSVGSVGKIGFNPPVPSPLGPGAGDAAAAAALSSARSSYAASSPLTLGVNSVSVNSMNGVGIERGQADACVDVDVDVDVDGCLVKVGGEMHEPARDINVGGGGGGGGGDGYSSGNGEGKGQDEFGVDVDRVALVPVSAFAGANPALDHAAKTLAASSTDIPADTDAIGAGVGAAGAAGATSFAPSKDDGVLEDGLIQSHNESEYRAEVRDDSLHGIEPDSEAESGDDDGWLEDTEPPYGFVTGAEFEAIKAVPAAADDPDVLDLFLRLCQYFRGQHPLEEIMWRENLSRQQLAGVLSSFSGVLTRITR